MEVIATCHAHSATPADLLTSTKAVPLKYLDELDKFDPFKRAALTNKATHVLTINATLPALGYGVFHVRLGRNTEELWAARQETARAEQGQEQEQRQKKPSAPTTITNGLLTLTIEDKVLSTLKNNQDGGDAIAFLPQIGYYSSSEGGCTPGVVNTKTNPACSGQKSGAYIFRPNSTAASMLSIKVSTTHCTEEVTATCHAHSAPPADLITSLSSSYASRASPSCRRPRT